MIIIFEIGFVHELVFKMRVAFLMIRAMMQDIHNFDVKIVMVCLYMCLWCLGCFIHFSEICSLWSVYLFYTLPALVYLLRII